MSPAIFPLGLILMSAVLMVYGWKNRYRLVRRRLTPLNSAAYDLIYASMSDAVVMLDSEQRIRLVNPAAERALGIDKHRLLGRLFPSVMPEIAELPLFTDTPVSFETGLAGPTVYLGKCQPVRSQELVKGWLIVLHDVTEQRRAQANLSASEQRAKALVDALPDMMVRFNRAGIIVDYKADPQHLFGLQPTLGAHASHTFIPAFGDRIEAAIAETLRRQHIMSFEIQYDMPGGGMRDYLARMVPSGTDEVVAIVQDVTERKQAERAAAAHQLDTERANIMTDFIRSSIEGFRPRLAQISMAVDALEQYPQDRGAHIAYIDHASDLLSSQISHLIDVITPPKS